MMHDRRSTSLPRPRQRVSQTLQMHQQVMERGQSHTRPRFTVFITSFIILTNCLQNSRQDEVMTRPRSLQSRLLLWQIHPSVRRHCGNGIRKADHGVQCRLQKGCAARCPQGSESHWMYAVRQSKYSMTDVSDRRRGCWVDESCSFCTGTVT
jgi:hypothetical protein